MWTTYPKENKIKLNKSSKTSHENNVDSEISVSTSKQDDTPTTFAYEQSTYVWL